MMTSQPATGPMSPRRAMTGELLCMPLYDGGVSGVISGMVAPAPGMGMVTSSAEAEEPTALKGMVLGPAPAPV